ncbi:hypothetical protein ACIQPT_02215 [Streptomyces sp. NPDC091289]|uniref:hypothetical protein n=1 Tax=Streptomyces sp. NPDC091289 TaxID=3365989 RepID=UPI0037F6D356
MNEHTTDVPPVEVHCHGFGDVDFSDFRKVDLARLDDWCASEAVQALPTMYLRRDKLSEFEEFVRRYDAMRKDGLLPHIPGIALEGPLLASHGGTPAQTVWAPTRGEWSRLAALGELGLKYTVMSPDAFRQGSTLHDAPEAREAGFDWILPELLAHGVRPALGHFTRQDPRAGAELAAEMVEIAWQSEFGGSGARVVTDHLFNDMPLTIRHAFRSTAARRERDRVIASYDLPGWSLDALDTIVGPVPATIMREAARGRVAACINFDGEHVDLAIATRAVQLMGIPHSMMMTDRCDSARLGGQDLHRTEDNGLWYQNAGIVAAGSQPLARQMANALGQGLTEPEVRMLAGGTAHRAFGLTTTAPQLVPAGRR